MICTKFSYLLLEEDISDYGPFLNAYLNNLRVKQAKEEFGNPQNPDELE